MSHELIFTWLGLEPGDWPPDHYRLLGLEPSESDSARIEQRVHDRLEAVRRYQLLHPELVTEAMNRLAQAYVCLTDPDARRAYDNARSGRPAGNGSKATAARPTRRKPTTGRLPPLPAPLTSPAPAPAPQPPPPEVPPAPKVELLPVATPAPPVAVPAPPVAVPAPPAAVPVPPVVVPAPLVVVP